MGGAALKTATPPSATAGRAAEFARSSAAEETIGDFTAAHADGLTRRTRTYSRSAPRARSATSLVVPTAYSRSAPRTTQALIFEASRRVALKDVPIPEIAADEALVEVHACGLCGTDLAKIFNGRFSPPVPIGHEVAGRIVALGRKAENFKMGDRVVVAHHVPCFKCRYCRRGSESMCREFKATNIYPGGFSQFIRVSGGHLRHTVLKFPSQMDFLTASQTEPLACCVRSARRLNAGKGDVAVVVGLGAIGLMMAQVLLARKVTVVGLDLDADRIRLAQSLGVRHASSGDEPQIEELVRSLSGKRGADAIIFTAGAPALVARHLRWLRDGGTINILAGFHPDPNMTLDLDAVYHREITLLSSYSAAPEDLRKALELLASGKIDLKAYTRHTFSLDRFDDAAELVRRRRILKAIFLPRARSTTSPAAGADQSEKTSFHGAATGLSDAAAEVQCAFPVSRMEKAS